MVGDDEEQWLAVEKPRALGRPNVVAGGLPGKLCAHFAFFTQRPTLDATSILASYEALAPPLALTEVVSMNSDGRFEAFVRDLPSCADADGLAELIGSLGLFADNRDLYAPRFAHRQLDKGGMWQEPSELAEALWSLRDELRAVHALHQQPERPLRFLEIGTFTGYTFFVIREFIRAHVTSNLLARTYDPNDLVSDDIRAWIERDFVRGTSAEAAEAPWDFVFIDGCHEAPWPLLDFERLHTGAKIVMFHDVVDRYCPDVRLGDRSGRRVFPPYVGRKPCDELRDDVRGRRVAVQVAAQEQRQRHRGVHRAEARVHRKPHDDRQRQSDAQRGSDAVVDLGHVQDDGYEYKRAYQFGEERKRNQHYGYYFSLILFLKYEFKISWVVRCVEVVFVQLSP